jgi:asparagine synthase (glutamine-hydrolysing)
MVDGESIKSMGIKMVLSGEGADEFLRVFVFPQSTKRKRIHEENVRKLGKLHMYDCLRANKSLAAWELKDVCHFR